MLYTRKGDGGTTKTFGCDQRISKSSAVAEALGTLDELNSFLGVVKAELIGKDIKILGKNLSEVAHDAQRNLFIVQAELAGAPKTIPIEKVKEVELIVDTAEKEMPPIKTFFIPGATRAGAYFDFARTLARRAERRVVGVHEEGKVKIGAETLSYLNRLSSLLYAMARYSNFKEGAPEEPPSYK